MLEHLSDFFFSAKLWFLKLIGLFLVWFEPARELSLMLIIFVVIDGLLDVWVAIDSKQKLNFKEFLIKKIKDVTLFLVYILVIHYFQVSYLKEELAVFKVMVGIPLIALLSGIVENIESLTGIKVATEVKELLSSIFSKLKDKATKKDE